jgi:HPt (histidine-containing phosphotransfer) domain-containing protein
MAAAMLLPQEGRVMSILASVSQAVNSRRGVHAAELGNAADAQPSIDLVHLSRQTLGDKDLEVELLNLFARQAKTIIQALMANNPNMAQKSADLLHTLCGSARAVGSWRIAEQAQKPEHDMRAADANPGTGLNRDKLTELKASVERACLVINDLLGKHD